MDVSHLHSSIDVDAFANWLGLTSPSARQALQARLTIWRYDIKELQSLSYQYSTVKEALTKNPKVADELQQLSVVAHPSGAAHRSALCENRVLAHGHR